jgi:hypothetical protein
LIKLDNLSIAYYLANAESCDGVTVTPAGDQSIIDSNNHKWTLKKSKVQYGETECKDIKWSNLLLYWNHTVYCQDYDYPNKWWKWINNKWDDAHDPRPSPTSTVAPECTRPPSTGRYDSLSQKIIFYTVNH